MTPEVVSQIIFTLFVSKSILLVGNDLTDLVITIMEVIKPFDASSYTVDCNLTEDRIPLLDAPFPAIICCSQALYESKIQDSVELAESIKDTLIVFTSKDEFKPIESYGFPSNLFTMLKIELQSAFSARVDNTNIETFPF